MSETTCAVIECRQPARERGWCSAHYGRWVRHGDPTAGREIDPVKRFLAQLSPPDDHGCRRWLGARTDNGYGIARGTTAHRAAYILFVGPIPEGMQIDHVAARGCRYRDCCEVSHLEPVTGRENVLRGRTFAADNAAKTHCPKGHEYTAANTYQRRDRNGRQCRACGREWQRLKT